MTLSSIFGLLSNPWVITLVRYRLLQTRRNYRTESRVETEIDPSACEAAFCACSVLLQFESGSLSFSLLCRRVECEGLI